MSKKDHPLDEYWYSLGRFVHAFAIAEDVVSNILWIESNTTARMSRALFSGTRMRAAIDLIKRIHEEQGRTLDPLLARAFPKLAEINTVRDKILHHGHHVHGSSVLVADDERTIVKKATAFLVSAPDLEAIRTDTLTATACLSLYWQMKRYPNHVRKIENNRRVASRQWLYKSPQRANTKGMLLQAAQKQKPSRQSSAG